MHLLRVNIDTNPLVTEFRTSESHHENEERRRGKRETPRDSKMSAKADRPERRERTDRGEKEEKLLEKGDGVERERERSGRGRRSRMEGGGGPESAVNSRPQSAAVKPGLDLVDITSGSKFSKRCVYLTVTLIGLFCLLLGAAIFYLIYYLAYEMSYCPWTQLETGCYQFFQDSRNWTDAQDLCTLRGGRLAELKGYDKQLDVVHLFRVGGHKPSCFWIGGIESDPEEMIFSWVTSGRPMKRDYTNWESGHPKNRSVATCVDFCHPDFLWKNKACSLKQNYLCEFG